MVDLSSYQTEKISKKKKNRVDTRNNWVTLMFVTKCRRKNFRKQTHIDTCTNAFKELERFGFKFDEIGFGADHVHFLVDIPKKYSVEDAEIMLKSASAKCMFEKHPGFRKLYPRGSFWSGYEHHESTGLKDMNTSRVYIQDQPRHHNVTVIDDRQQKLNQFFSVAEAPTDGTAVPE